ncbi:MAG: sodium/solute symporter [Rhodopirellula sp.]|nr:sodium/solute symporter [Rhodopirellula sp.]
MGEVFQTLDIVLFFVALVGVMIVGLIAGRKEETSEDYFLAGKTIPWWGVAGSIYGSNVSANHMVGMMGVGFSIGFFQSHFELGAILGLMVLCYGFLPVYRKLGVYTLSEYLGRRYDDRSRVSYAVIMIIIMAAVQMVPGLYIGSRTICVLLGGDAVEEVAQPAATADAITADAAAAGESAAGETVTATAETAPTKSKVKYSYYALFVILLAITSAAYTIFGGLKAVVWTDFLQSMLLLVAGIAIAILTFHELGGWGEMMRLDQAEVRDDQRMHIYLPTNHPQLPWTGVFTGLMAMHCFYWGTNQFIVQRALGARSDSDAKLGIVAAGFLKLLIPFFAIAPGVAAYYLFQQRLPDRTVSPDAVFPELVKLVIPLGYGLIGIIGAGLIGAILSSIDSMMNSAATIVTFDIYKKYMKPDASDDEMIHAGRISIVGFVIFATLLALLIMDPNSEKNFFLQIADYQNYFTPGLLVAFFMGMFWPRGTATGAFAAIISGVFFSWLAEYLYNANIESWPAVQQHLGTKLNFFHRVVFVLGLSGLIHVVVSLLTQPDEAKGRLNWTDLGGHSAGDLKSLVSLIILSMLVFAVLGATMVKGWFVPGVAASIAAVWTLAVFQFHISSHRRVLSPDSDGENLPETMTEAAKELVPLVSDDRFWASLLCSAAVFMHYYYY